MLAISHAPLAVAAEAHPPTRLNDQSSEAEHAPGLTAQVNRVEFPELPFNRPGHRPGYWPPFNGESSVSTPNAKGKDRHQEILDAAARVITDRGLAETRISDIAEQAGVSPGLILYYFESKDRLLSEALTFANDQFYLRMSREIRRIASAREQLRRMIDLSVPGYLPEYGRLDEWALWIEVWVRALRDTEMAKDREVLDQRWRSQIADIVRGGQASGEFTAPQDADELALRLAAIIDGLAIQVIMNDSLVTTERMHRTTMEVAAQTLGFQLEPAAG
ncbi:MAG TPA: TetR/AcrR family transcriptional regulator [Actinomycetota bacterium]|nr:TetR/AcrR family transcriptional regulator [Actinomycetota bacterium]